MTEARIAAVDTARRTNAELILDAHNLGYLPGHVYDPTYGLGRWWTLWRPDVFTASDIDPDRSPYGIPIDFTDTEWPDSTFDTVAFDPPYKLNGTGGSGPGDEAYDVAGAYVPVADRHDLIKAGITELTRILKPGGYLLIKMQDQVSSGRVHWQTKIFYAHTTFLGCQLVDELHLVGARAQPKGRHQRHASRNYSTLQVYRTQR